MSEEVGSIFWDDFRLTNGAIASVEASTDRVWVIVEHEQEYAYEPPEQSSLSIEEAERLIVLLQQAVAAMKAAS